MNQRTKQDLESRPVAKALSAVSRAVRARPARFRLRGPAEEVQDVRVNRRDSRIDVAKARITLTYRRGSPCGRKAKRPWLIATTCEHRGSDRNTA